MRYAIDLTLFTYILLLFLHFYFPFFHFVDYKIYDAKDTQGTRFSVPLGDSLGAR